MTMHVHFLDLRLLGQLDAIPTVGSSSWLGSWWAGLKYVANAVYTIRKGYKKASLHALQISCKFTTFQYETAPFKFATMFSWTVVINSHEHIREIWKAPEDVLSFSEAVNDASHCLVSSGYLR